MEALDSFGTVKPSRTIMLFFLLGPLFPGLFSRLSNQRNARVQALVKGVEEIAEGVLARAKAEEDEEEGGQSIIGLFGKLLSFLFDPHGFREECTALTMYNL